MRYIVATVFILGTAACEVDEVTDPNNPSLASVQEGASRAELQSLVTGLEARHREYFANATQMFGSFGREVWAFFASDPRFLNDWLGKNNVSETYPNFFASEDTYVAPYTAVKQANVLIDAAVNTSVITPAEQAGYTGFAKTIKAYQLLFPLLQQYENGIRVDVEDPLNPGPIVSYDEALQIIRGLLDEGAQDLQGAGEAFDFALTPGFSNFNTPATFLQVNRAIAARAALYAEDWPGTLMALEGSFLDLNVDAGSSDKMAVGPAHVWGNAPDEPNPLFYPLDAATNTILIAHTALIEDSLPGDQRVRNKFFERAEPVTSSGLRDNQDGQIPGIYQDKRWETNTTPIPFIRNEELILLYAEAQARSGGTTEAVEAINTVRNTWEVEDYSGGTSLDELIDEILLQRRYSLWAEGGHRWIDLRRTGRLNEDYIDLRDGGTIFTQVSRRTTETNWEQNNE